MSNVLLSVDIWATVKHALSAAGGEEQVPLSPLSAVSAAAPVMEINEVSGESYAPSNAATIWSGGPILILNSKAVRVLVNLSFGTEGRLGICEGERGSGGEARAREMKGGSHMSKHWGHFFLGALGVLNLKKMTSPSSTV